MMARITKFHLVLVPLMVLGTVACKRAAGPSAENEQRSEILAQVGGSAVTQAQVEEHLSRMSQLQRDRYETEQGRADVIDAIIERRLLVQEARRQNLHEQPDIQRKIEEILAARLIERETERRFTDEIARQLYDANRDRFTSREAHLRQILIRPGAHGGEKKAAEIAGRVVRELGTGASFEMLAKTYSDDQISAPRGGDLGWMTYGSLPKNLAAAAFSLEAGEVTGALQTPHGFHVLQLVEPVRVKERSLGEVRPLLRSMFQESVRKSLVEELERKTTVSRRGQGAKS